MTRKKVGDDRATGRKQAGDGVRRRGDCDDSGVREEEAVARREGEGFVAGRWLVHRGRVAGRRGAMARWSGRRRQGRPRGRAADGGRRGALIDGGEGALVPDPDRDEERRDVGSGRSGLGFDVPWGLVGEVGWAGPAGPACS